ncbi:MAG: hypothetical protein IT581_19405 [Verrucomicrobiales bacterium]|nr:hypothetical protein [Verrucomicrobiales bacterium]
MEGWFPAFQLLLGLTTVLASAPAKAGQSEWFQGGSPYGASDTRFWEELERIPGAFTLPVNPGSDFRFGSYRLSIVTSGGSTLPPRATLYDGANGETSVTIYVQMDYSVGNFIDPNPGVDASGAVAREYYEGGIEVAGLRRLEDTSPCPLQETPQIWCHTDESEGPYTYSQLQFLPHTSLFPLAFSGSSYAISNIYGFHFTHVPRGRYAFYALTSGAVYSDLGTWEGTNKAAAVFLVDSLSIAGGSQGDILSPSPHAEVQLGKPIQISYKLGTLGTTLSLLNYQLIADGQILTNRVLRWGNRAQVLNESVTWIPQRLGTNLIEIRGTDTDCLPLRGETTRVPVKVVEFADPSTQALRLSVRLGDGSIRVSLNSVSGRTYRLQMRSSLVDGAWVDVGEPVHSVGGILSFPSMTLTAGPVFLRGIEGSATVPDLAWRDADLVFPAGTQTIRVHMDDPYTYQTNRGVRVGLRSPDGGWGWSTWVYPDAFIGGTELVNSTFFLSGGSGPGAVPFTGLTALDPGKVYTVSIVCESVAKPDSFNFLGLDGVLVIDEPTNMVKGGSRFFVHLLPRQSREVTFSVAPR